MTYQNCKGDFLIVESFYVDEAKAQPMPVPEHIRIEYFTMYGNGSRYVVERDGDTCSSCSVSEDGMSLISNIPLSRYPLGTGELMKLVVEIVADPAFPDGKKYITTPGTTGIMLFPGVSDGSPEIQSSIVMPISQYGMSAYQLAVLHGFSGTEKEWLQSLNNGAMPVLAPKPADPVAGQYHFNTLRQGIGVFDGTRWNWTEKRGNKGLRVVVGRAIPMFPEVGTAYVFTDELLKIKIEKSKLTKFGGSINLSRFGNVKFILDTAGKKIEGMMSSTISIEDWDDITWGPTIVIFFEGDDSFKLASQNALFITSSGCIQDCGCKLCRIYSSETASPFLVLSKGKIICIKPVRKYITETSQLVSTSTLLVKRWKGTRRKHACTQPGTKYKRLSYRRRYVTIHRLGRSGQTPILRSPGLRLRLQSVHRSRFVSVLPQDIYVRKGFLDQ